jgi:radical SAM protein with 4Fe4S-binding SPASM domain
MGNNDVKMGKGGGGRLDKQGKPSSRQRETKTQGLVKLWREIKRLLRKPNLLQIDSTPPLCVPLNKLRMVEIEIFSYCNRQCWFCPNSLIDRHSGNILMDESLYLYVLNDLQSINFDGMISYSRYNEPLSNKEIFIERLKQAKKILPNACLHTNTNGDYLTREYLDDLYAAGLNSMNIQCYLREDEEFNVENIKSKIDSFAQKLGGLSSRVSFISSERYEVIFDYENLKMYARDFRKNGNTRGGSLQTIPSTKRNVPCLIPFTDIYIDYNGSVMPCCNFRSDINEHESFILGNIHTHSILEIFNNQKTQELRRVLRNDNIQIYPCSECNFGLTHKISARADGR